MSNQNFNTRYGLSVGAAETQIIDPSGNITSPSLNISGAISSTSLTISGSATIGTNLVVTGNLTVNGTTETINSTIVNILDSNIHIGTVVTPTDITAAGGGITLMGATNKTIKWSTVANGWEFSENSNLISGKQYLINGVSVLNSTTLGIGILNSSLISVGNLTSLTITGSGNFNAISATTIFASGLATFGNGLTSTAGTTTLGVTNTGTLTSTVTANTTSLTANSSLASSTGITMPVMSVYDSRTFSGSGGTGSGLTIYSRGDTLGTASYAGYKFINVTNGISSSSVFDIDGNGRVNAYHDLVVTGGISALGTLYTSSTIQLASAMIGTGAQTWIGGNSNSTSWFINTPTGSSTTIGVNNVGVASFSASGLTVVGTTILGVTNTGALTVTNADLLIGNSTRNNGLTVSRTGANASSVGLAANGNSGMLTYSYTSGGVDIYDLTASLVRENISAAGLHTFNYGLTETSGSITTGSNTVHNATVTLNSAAASGYGTYIVGCNVGLPDYAIGNYGAISSGTDRSLFLQSYNDNIILSSPSSGKTIILNSNGVNTAVISSAGVAITGALTTTAPITNIPVANINQIAFNSTTSGTGFNTITLNNTGGQLLFGLDNSTGTGLGTATAYGGTIISPTTLSVIIGSSIVTRTSTTGLTVNGILGAITANGTIAARFGGQTSAKLRVISGALDTDGIIIGAINNAENLYEPIHYYASQHTFIGVLNSTEGITTSTSFSGAGTGLTGIANSLSIGGNAATATNALSLGGSLASAFAMLVSPAFTGVPVAPTAASGNNTTQIATTAFVAAAAASSTTILSQVLAYAATVTWNSSLGIVAKLTLSGNSTIANPINLVVGTYVLTFIQDATGSRTVTWGTAFKFPGGIKPVLSTAANAIDLMTFFSDGTTMYGSYLRGMS